MPSREVLAFGIVVAVIYGLVAIALLAPRGFDPSAFLLLGDRYVDQSALPSPARALRNASGFDGQFYYRLAIDPFARAEQVSGIRFDFPAYRAQRIGYPVLAWAFSLGEPSRAAAALFAVNLLAVLLLAAVAAWLVRAGELSWAGCALICGWPGFLVSLTHDTSEIVQSVLLLAALACFLKERRGWYALLAFCALMTRETALPILGGIALAETVRALRSAEAPRAGRIGLVLAPLVAWGVWWAINAWRFGDVAQAQVAGLNLGPPFLNLAKVLATNLSPTHQWSPDLAIEAFTRTAFLSTLVAFLAFLGFAAYRLAREPADGERAPLLVGWCAAALLLLCLGSGPMSEPQSYLRVFTECWIVGWLLLGPRLGESAAGRVSVRVVGYSLAIGFATMFVWIQSYLP
jgi:hypothetical protein